MENTAIAPALTAEEWANVRVTKGGAVIGVAYYLIEHDGLVVGWSREQGSHFGGADLPRLTALANAALPDDDPRKVTREMVRALHDEISEKYERLAAAPMSGFNPWPRMESLKALRDALTALLPPA